MSKTTFTVVAPPADAGHIPDLDASQSTVRAAAQHGNVVFRGAPGSGKTTTLLAVVADAVEAGQSIAVLVPDRARAERLAGRVHAIAPGVARPVKTAVGFAYAVIDTWRNLRADPLGGVELLTGAQEDALVAELVVSQESEELSRYMSNGVPSSLLRMEMRNLVATADRYGVSEGELMGFAQAYNFPLWTNGARLLFDMNAGINPEMRGALRLRHSQVERMAADLLERWERDAAQYQVTGPLPVPDLVVVDGLQDMTAATLRMLQALASCGARIAIASEPDASVATYRGAIPQADVLAARSLGVTILELDTIYRGTSQIRGAVRRVSENITMAGPARRRASQLATVEESDSQSIFVHAAHTDAQMGAHIARILRENYLFHDTAWSEQVVIVRSQAIASQVRRHLRRASVPLNTSTRAFEFMSEPTTRLLIDLLLKAALTGDSDYEKTMYDLVTSAFIGVDPVDLHRVLRTYSAILARTLADDEDPTPLLLGDLLIRAYRDPAHDPLHDTALHSDAAAHLETNSESEEHLGTDGEPAESQDEPHNTPTGNATLPSSVAVDDKVLNETLRADCMAHPELAALADTLEKLTIAASMWHAAREGVTQRPRHALWNMWEAAGVASTWQERAISHTPDSHWYDTQLDAIVALFRVADVWEQRNPAAVASSFAEDLKDHNLPIDTLAPTPQRPDSVSVLTPSEAAGGQWPVVVVAGAQHERWPNVVLRNQMFHADTLADIILRTVTGAEQPTWADVTHIRQQRRRVRDDEYRMFIAAIGAAERELHLAVVSNEGSAPSELIDRALGSRPSDRVEHIERNEDGTAAYIVKPAPSPLDAVGVIGDLRYWACTPEHAGTQPTTTDSEARRGQEAAKGSDRATQHTTADGQIAEGENTEGGPHAERIATARRALAMLIVEGIRGAHPREWETPGPLTSDAPILGQVKPSISPSAVENIETCPLHWFASKIGADSTPGHSAASRGTFVHALAEDYHNDPSTPIRSLFEQRWPAYSEGLESLEKKREYDKINALVNGLEAYFAHVPEWVEEMTEVELFINQDMGSYRIRGKIDRLEPDGEGIKIVDFKTGKAKKPDEAIVDPQLQTYQVALIAGGANVTGAQLQYLGEGERGGRNPAPAHINGMRLQDRLTHEQYADRRQQLEHDIATMNAASFQAILGPKCDYCSLKGICPAQHQREGDTNV